MRWCARQATSDNHDDANLNSTRVFNRSFLDEEWRLASKAMRDIPPFQASDTASPISRMASFGRAGPMRGQMGLGRVNISVSAAAHWPSVPKAKKPTGNCSWTAVKG